MKFAVVGLEDTKKIVGILNSYGHNIDDKPNYVITYGGDGSILLSERLYPGIPKITIRKDSIGFRCLFSESDLENILQKIQNEDINLKEEIKLETEYKTERYLSLNEAQFHNYSPVRAVRFSVFVNNNKLYSNVIGDGVVISTPFGSTGYYASIIGVKEGFEGNWIGIALNNPYKYEAAKDIMYKFSLVDINSEIKIMVLRDSGLLMFDNDEKIIQVREGEEIKIKVSKDKARFVMSNNNKSLQR